MVLICCDGDCCLQRIADTDAEQARRRAVTAGWRPRGDEWFCPGCQEEITVEVEYDIGGEG